MHTDDIIRAATSAETLAKRRAVFAKDGTRIAGNSSPLTAAAVLLMSEEKATALG